MIKKIIGWGRNTITDPELGSYSDIVAESTDLSIEEGQENEAPIEGGEAEGRKKDPDKYILVANRRIGDESEVSEVLGYTESVDNVECYPDNGGLGVKLINPSRHVSLKMNTRDGLVAVYTYKTKGQTDDHGHPTDIEIGRNTKKVTYTAVADSSGKSPKAEGWYIKNGTRYVRSFDTDAQSGMTY